MATALIYGASGAGKTVNATRVVGKNLLLISDNSECVLKHFEREELKIEKIERWLLKGKTGSIQNCFVEQYEQAFKDVKYDNIIIDNLTDLLELAILDMDYYKISNDRRQHYMLAYQTIKRLVREATHLRCNVIFTAWEETSYLPDSSGTMQQVVRPELPAAIHNKICGLCNIVGRVVSTERDGQRMWFYNLSGSGNTMAKDQLWMRKSCLPENIFEKGTHP